LVSTERPAVPSAMGKNNCPTVPAVVLNCAGAYSEVDICTCSAATEDPDPTGLVDYSLRLNMRAVFSFGLSAVLCG